MKKILVWDLATRAFHWLLAGAFTVAFATGDSERLRDVHVLAGYAVAGLIAFRLVWGLAGPRYARFRSFTFGPRRVASYLRSLLTRTPHHYLGHNPAGSWVIFALLGLGAISAAGGYALHEGLGGGRVADALEELHEGAAHAMLALVLVHLAGVVVSSLIHRENLVAAMVTGRKRDFRRP